LIPFELAQQQLREPPYYVRFRHMIIDERFSASPTAVDAGTRAEAREEARSQEAAA